MQLASDPAMARFNISLYQDSIWNFKVNYTGEYPLNLERTLFKQIPFKKDSCFLNLFVRTQIRVKIDTILMM